MLRCTLLPMTLGIEHFSKTKLMCKLAGRSEEDGYSVVADCLVSFPRWVS